MVKKEATNVKGSPPRKLTKDEIDNILEEVDDPPGLLPVQTRFARDEIRKVVRLQLEEIEIVPEAILELKSTISRRYQEAKVTPGLSVGHGSGEAQADILQQSMLDAVHKTGRSGAAGSGSNIDIIKQILLVSRNPKYVLTYVHFKERQSYNSIFVHRKNMVRISLDKFVENYYIEYSRTLFESEGLPWWYSLYHWSQGIPPVKMSEDGEDRILRLYLSPRLMAEYGVGMQDIVRVLEDHKPRMFRVVASPTYLGIVDIWPIPDAVIAAVSEKYLNSDPDLAIFKMLKHGLLAELHNFNIRGIPEITNLEPEELNVWHSMYLSEEDLGGGVVKVRIAPQFMVMGPEWSQVREVMELLGLRIMEESEFEWFKILVPEEIRDDDSRKKIYNYANKKIAEINELDKGKAEENQIGSPLKYYYGIATGSNLRVVLSLPTVNPRVTCCSNPVETLQVLGRDAARSIALRELSTAYDFERTGGPFNHRHLLFTVDYMIYSGILTPNNYGGLAGRGKNVIALASSEQQMGTYVKFGSMGIRQDADDISTRITLGGTPLIGRGIYRQFNEEGISEEEFKKRLSESQGKTISGEEMSSAVEQMIIKQFSADPARQLLSGDKEEEEELPMDGEDEEEELPMDGEEEEEEEYSTEVVTIMDDGVMDYSLPPGFVVSQAVNETVQGMDDKAPAVVGCEPVAASVDASSETPMPKVKKVKTGSQKSKVTEKIATGVVPNSVSIPSTKGDMKDLINDPKCFRRTEERQDEAKEVEFLDIDDQVGI